MSVEDRLARLRRGSAEARSSGRPPAWTLVAATLVALATWFVGFNNPAPGLDPSWGSGLYMALEDGIPFGTDVVFTYGPLGFLVNAVGWDSGLASIAYVWLAVLHIGFAWALIWTLRPSVGLIAGSLVAFVVLTLLLAVEVPFALGAIACFAVLQPQRPRHAVWALAIGGALFAAIEVLVKLSVGPPLLAIFVIALIGARASRAQIAVFAGVFLASVPLLWLATGQSLGQLPEYVANGREIVSGYSEAMTISQGTYLEGTGGMAVAVLVLVALVAGAAFASYRDRLARLCGIAVAALVGFSLFKSGVVRFDAPHLGAYLSTMVVFWMALPWGESRRWIAALGAVALLAIAIPLQLRDGAGRAFDLMDAPANVERALVQTKNLFQPGEREETAEVARAFMAAAYDVDERILAELEGRTVAIEPWEIAVAWAYDLDWDPLPVIQGYSAYTAALDELNAERVASPDGPERILRQNAAGSVNAFPMRAIDNRFPSWDPPAQALATLCNFEPLQTTDGWQLLGRVPDRCAEPVAAGSVEAGSGEMVEVPQAGPGEVVFVRIDGAEVAGLESLVTLAYRARLRFVQVDDEIYRLVPGTAGGGLLLNGDPDLLGIGPFAQSPQAETIAFSGPNADLRYDFYVMSVDASTSALPGQGGN